MHNGEIGVDPNPPLLRTPYGRGSVCAEANGPGYVIRANGMKVRTSYPRRDEKSSLLSFLRQLNSAGLIPLFKGINRARSKCF